MKTYIVKLTPTAENAFAAIQYFDPNVVIEIEDFTANLYSIETEHSIDHLLDDAPGVQSYQVTQ